MDDKARFRTSSISQGEFCQILARRAATMAAGNDSTTQLDSIICTYLIDFFMNHVDQSDPRGFPAKLTGILTRAFDDLALLSTDEAVTFIKRYNRIGRNTFHGGWRDVKNLQLTHVDAPDYRLNILYVIKNIIYDVFGGDYKPVDFAVLEAEHNVMTLRFQQFLNRVWEHGGAKTCRVSHSTKNCFSGVFGCVRFTTWRNPEWVIFEICDARDEFYSFRFIAPIVFLATVPAPYSDSAVVSTVDTYHAMLFGCHVDLISALQMFDEVINSFDLADYHEDKRPLTGPQPPHIITPAQ